MRTAARLPLLPPRGFYPRHRHPLTIDEAACAWNDGGDRTAWRAAAGAAPVRCGGDGMDVDEMGCGTCGAGAQPLVPTCGGVEEMRDAMRDEMRDEMWDVGRAVDVRAKPRVAGAPVPLARQPPHRAARPPPAARTAWPRHRCHPRRRIAFLSVEEASQLARGGRHAAGRPLKKSPIDWRARRAARPFSSSSPSSLRPRSPPRPAAAAAPAPAPPNDSRGTAAACAADELGAESVSGAVGRRTRSATTPAARSIAAVGSERDLDAVAVIRRPARAAAAAPGWSALTMARCGALRRCRSVERCRSALGTDGAA